MSEFKVLHVEDDNDYHFLLSQYFIREGIPLLWGVNRKETLLLLEEHEVDAIVFDGQIHGWKDHIEEVLAITNRSIPFIILSGADIFKLAEFKDNGYTAHQKNLEGIRAVVRYIKNLSEDRKPK